MAKKHQRREHVSVRKKREEEQKLAKRREFYQQHKKQLWTGVIAAAAAIVLIWLAVDFFYCPGGSMRMFLGRLMDVEENAIIRNLGSTKSPLYFNLGSFDAPEGYTSDPDYNPPSDENEHNFYYYTDDTDRVIHDVFVSGVKDKTSAEMAETIANSGMYSSLSEKRTAEIAGHQVTYLYAQGNPSSEDSSVYYAVLIMYVDTVKDCSILINCTSHRGALEELPAEEAMVAEAEAILANLTVAGK